MLGWFRRARNGKAVSRLYGIVVTQSRRPEFYRDMGVSDTLDGRFDMLVLHMVLVLRRLQMEQDGGGGFGQALFDFMFVDMDRSLREIGVSDLSVGKRVKEMARAFQGRVIAYEQGLRCGQNAALEDALLRNVYRGAAYGRGKVQYLADYVRRIDAVLLGLSVNTLLDGTVDLGAAIIGQGVGCATRARGAGP